ncbi:succinate dehydrogenase [Plasmopara halstedii]|uniref:Succinate dehydrogenase n=1 Tax=Plasmopara halstedii TaxID=4781 RepID=A0A0P1B5D4_PLAHL|nr:succinate dehydrogenase [Plasmopara halstedii]CEG49192.1 succinate dehydrogenase [Plasmopara halstedii]|eukprot:XP_024585561.1 succinate dehydrogenase [Plasmopara halstedii]
MTDRVRVLRQLGEQIRLREQDLSRMITLEMGKPIAQARAESRMVYHSSWAT